jgi:hypothetical protein
MNAATTLLPPALPPTVALDMADDFEAAKPEIAKILRAILDSISLVFQR